MLTMLAAPIASAHTCPLSQGYWKNHDSAWRVSSVTLGSVSYSHAQLSTILNTAPAGDASIILAHQLIAAKLNVANGSAFFPPAIQTVINQAIAMGDSLLGANNLLNPAYSVDPSSPTGQLMVGAANVLNNFNTGVLTIGVCGSF
jgi:hypothetical protein